MQTSSTILVCFAVKEEAKFFPVAERPAGCVTLITGMGRRNAEVAVRKVLTQARPELVITAGFAGGLRPELKTGAVVFEEDAEAGLAAKLQGAGAVPARFYCAERVAITVAEKAAFWKSTGADAVEMESSAIRAICRELKIPSATVRVISDSAQEDLPLDFNALMTAGDRINYAKLFWTIARSPGKIASLMQFQKRTVAAARALGEVLRQSLGGGR